VVAKPELPIPRLREFCSKWKIAELAVFGSYLRDDFGPDSDIDFLVTWAPSADWSLLDLVRMERELGTIIGCKADVVLRRTVERSRNWIRREEILSSAKTLIAA
jgi:predicted nucleotidyltransferase